MSNNLIDLVEIRERRAAQAALRARFSQRRTPWHRVGQDIIGASNVEEALSQANMNWSVLSKPIMVEGMEISDYRANVRETDNEVLGIVSKNYKIIQNLEAFSFADELVREGVIFEKAGMFGKNGSHVWLLGKLPNDYKILGEPTDPYIVITNSHDGGGALTVAFIPMRIACSNALNLALKKSERRAAITHQGNVVQKIIMAHRTLGYADDYLKELQSEAEILQQIRLGDGDVLKYIERLLPLKEGASERTQQNIEAKRAALADRYFNAPDIQHFGDTGYRLVNAVSDFVTHEEPTRRTQSYDANLFARTIVGNSLVDQTVRMLKAAA